MKYLFALLCGLLLCPAITWAHASLLSTTPAAGSVLNQAPHQVVFTFSEPVGVTTMQLISPDGHRHKAQHVSDKNRQVQVTLPALKEKGTYLLSWRIVSADGHPVGGTLSYSVGTPSTPKVSTSSFAPVRDGLIWLTRWLGYVCLFACVGAALFRATGKTKDRYGWVVPLFVVGLVLLPLELGLQGLDMRGSGFETVLDPAVWSLALRSTYAMTLGLMALALLLSALVLRLSSVILMRLLIVAALVAMGFAMAVSGHAGTAPPQWLSKPLVALHVILVIAWVGLLIPLYRTLRSPQPDQLPDFDPLLSFSFWIVPVVVLLIVSGVSLAVLQLDHISDLWQTRYGMVLVTKLVLVAVLLLVAAANRWFWTQPACTGSVLALKHLRRSIKTEVVLAILILAVVSAWRLTPPPRSVDMRMDQPVTIMLQNAKVTAKVTKLKQSSDWEVNLSSSTGAPFSAQETTLALSNMKLGITDLRRQGEKQRKGKWIYHMPALPDVRAWKVRLVILIDDFDQVTLENKPDASMSDMPDMPHHPSHHKK